MRYNIDGTISIDADAFSQMQVGLEIIALGDSNDPQETARIALVNAGMWIDATPAQEGAKE
jgi:hypothetical protein